MKYGRQVVAPGNREGLANSPGSGSFIVRHVLVDDDDLSYGVWVGKRWKSSGKCDQKCGKLQSRPFNFCVDFAWEFIWKSFVSRIVEVDK